MELQFWDTTNNKIEKEKEGEAQNIHCILAMGNNNHVAMDHKLEYMYSKLGKKVVPAYYKYGPSIWTVWVNARIRHSPIMGMLERICDGEIKSYRYKWLMCYNSANIEICCGITAEIFHGGAVEVFRGIATALGATTIAVILKSTPHPFVPEESGTVY